MPALLTNALATVAAAARLPVQASTLCAGVALAAWCTALSVIDLRERRLPNTLTAAGAVSILGFGAATGRGTAAVAGALLLVLPYLLCHLVAPAAIGAGDVKLAVGLGAAAACGGTEAWVWAAITAPILTAVIGTGYLIPWRKCTGRHGLDPPHQSDIRASRADSALPHGPAMCLSTVAALLLTH